MRRGGLVAATVALLVLAPASTGGAPLGAQEWLGTWETGFGQIYFYELSYSDLIWGNEGRPEEHSGNGKRWLLRGHWQSPMGERDIKGTVYGHGYDGVSGCFVTDGPFGGTACYPILLARSDKRISGGYWKNCFLPENCMSHHPWHGTKKHGAYKVGFRFTQRGRPDGHAVIATQFGGAGSVLFEDLSGGTGNVAPGSAIVHIDEVDGQPQFTITPERGQVEVHHNTGRVILLMRGTVTRSTDSRCSIGATVYVTLRSAPPGDTSRVTITPQRQQDQPVCATKETWTSTDRTRLSVHVDAPHETP